MGLITPDLSGIVNGATPNATAWTNPFNTLINEFNGGIDNSNLSVTANIDGSKMLAASIANTKLSAFDKVQVSNSANQTIVTGVAQALNWDTDNYDTNAMHDTGANFSKITIATAGYYTITGLARWDGSTLGFTEAYFKKNGTTTLAYSDYPSSSVANVTHTLTMSVSLAVGDYIEFWVLQNSGGNRVVTASDSYFEAHLIP